jgi:molybdenum cofactor cytidylyltransferase
MIFRRFALSEAEGCLLAHSTRLQGGVVPKGAVLTASLVRSLAAAGQTHVVAARLEDGDVAEDAAAARLAAALAGPGLELRDAARGRANLLAAHAGLFRADAAAIDALNLLDEGVTVATLADATPVRAGTLLVTVKIIPFAIAGSVLARAEALAASAQKLRLPAFRPMRAGLVMTELPGMKEAVFRATAEATRHRVEGLTGCLLRPRRVPHNAADIASALAGLLAEGAELLLVAGASATVDRLDEGPAAIVLAGGDVTHFGMPVDPGNLICVGRIGAVPALVLPGCARSRNLNGIDLVLARIFAGEPAGAAQIARMGVGGLLKEFAPRPAPRLVSQAARPKVAGLILAAGMSRRAGPRNKLLAPDATGQPMVARVADAVLASSAGPVIAVLGHEADLVTQAFAGRDIFVAVAPDYAEGLSASLRAGLAAVPDDAAAVLVCLGDMPLVTAAQIDRLIEAYDPLEGRLIVVPAHNGQRGNPVLWDRRFFAAMAELTGDTGARALLQLHAESVVEVEMGSDAVTTDFDTPDRLEALSANGGYGEEAVPF